MLTSHRPVEGLRQEARAKRLPHHGPATLASSSLIDSPCCMQGYLAPSKWTRFVLVTRPVFEANWLTDFRVCVCVCVCVCACVCVCVCVLCLCV